MTRSSSWMNDLIRAPAQLKTSRPPTIRPGRPPTRRTRRCTGSRQRPSPSRATTTRSTAAVVACTRPRNPDHRQGCGHQRCRQRHRNGTGARLLTTHEPRPPGGCRLPDRARGSRRRSRSTAEGGASARAEVRPRPLDTLPLHDRRHDRERRLRRQEPGVRTHGGQRARSQAGAFRRRDVQHGLRRRWPADRSWRGRPDGDSCEPRSTGTSQWCARSSVASVARSPAMRSTTLHRSEAWTSPGRSSGPREHLRSSPRQRSGSCRTRHKEPWSSWVSRALPRQGDATPAVLAFTPSACEGLDARIVDVVLHRKGPTAVPELPAGKAWLLVELSGDDPGEVRSRIAALEQARLGSSLLVLEDPVRAASVWRIREDGAGLAGRAPSSRPAHPGWEDAAVPPDRLGEYLRRFEQLLTEHDLTAMPFGHFGEGCIHVRLDFPFDRPDGACPVQTVHRAGQRARGRARRFELR